MVKSKNLIFLVMFTILSLTIGYSAFGSDLSVSNIVAEVRIAADTRVTGFLYSSSDNLGISNYEDYNVDSLLTTVNLPNANSSVTYKVEVTNFGNAEMGIYELAGLPSNLTYELSDDYSLKTKICNASGNCTLGVSKDFYITIKYADSGYNSSDTEYSLNIGVDFREIYKITYENITNNNYPSYIIRGADLSINFTDPVPEILVIYLNNSRVDETLYTYSNNILTYENVSGDLIIKWPYKMYEIMEMATNGVDTDVSFTNISTTSNGYGVNTVSGTENDSFPVYYYRGAVTDNNVLFANFCWKALRTTSTGGVKLVYNGIPSDDRTCDNTGTNSQLSSTSKFNSKYNSLTYMGYMYGTIYEVGARDLSSQNDTYVYGNDVSYDSDTGMYTLVDTIESSSWSADYKTLATKYHYTCFNETGKCSSVYYIYIFSVSDHNPFTGYYTLSDGMNVESLKESAFANANNSVIKSTLDSWYKSNMINYEDYLEDTVYCNDRSIVYGPLGGKDFDSSNYNHSFFGGYVRTRRTYSPSLTCSNMNDSFSVSDEIGNGKLTHPVGLLTADEVAYAGAAQSNTNTSYYLYTGQKYWTMSPAVLTYAYMTSVNTSGYLTSNYGSNTELGVRPVISLSVGLYAIDGDGTVSRPYIIKKV